MKNLVGGITAVGIVAFLTLGIYRMANCAPATINVANVLQVSIGGCPAAAPPPPPNAHKRSPEEEMNRGGTSLNK
jgi:hypothetical protein